MNFSIFWWRFKGNKMNAETESRVHKVINYRHWSGAGLTAVPEGRGTVLYRLLWSILVSLESREEVFFFFFYFIRIFSIMWCRLINSVCYSSDSGRLKSCLEKPDVYIKVARIQLRSWIKFDTTDANMSGLTFFASRKPSSRRMKGSEGRPRWTRVL